MSERLTFIGWLREFVNKLLPVVTGIAITFTLQGVVNRSHERKSVRSAMELVRTELSSNLQDIDHLNDFLQQEVISAKYLSDHQQDLDACPADIVKYHKGQVDAYVTVVFSQNALELLKLSSLFPKVGDDDLSMGIIRAYDACEMLQTDINRHFSSRSASAVPRDPWLQLNVLDDYTVDIEAAIDAIDHFLMKR